MYATQVSCIGSKKGDGRTQAAFSCTKNSSLLQLAKRDPRQVLQSARWRRLAELKQRQKMLRTNRKSPSSLQA